MSTLELLAAVLLGLGTFFCVVGGIGLHRMPDFYTRTHAASITDTLGAALVLIGLMFLCAGQHWTVAVKLGMRSEERPVGTECRSRWSPDP